MQGNAPMHPGQGPGLSLHDLGEMSGSEVVTLLTSEMPVHNHNVQAFPNPGNVNTGDPTLALARSKGGSAYKAPPQNLVLMNAQAIGISGSSFPHNNMMPFLTLSFCIALQGVFPPRT